MERAETLRSTFRAATRSGGVVAWAGQLVWLACGLWLILAAQAPGQSKEPVTWFETELTLSLDDPASTLVAGDKGRALILSAATQTVAVLDIATASVRGKADLPGTPISAAAGPDEDNLGNYAVITRASDGYSYLTTLTATADGLRGRQMPGATVPGDFLTPAVIYLPQPSSPSGRAGETALLIWDAAPNQPTYSYQLAFSDYATSILSKDYPRQFLGIGSGLSVMGLQSDANRVAITDALSGSLLDVILVRGLATKDPAHLAVFTPMAAGGGNGSVVIANGDEGVLTVLLARPGPEPLLETPLQIPLNAAPALAADQRLLVAATASLGVILVGTQGSADLALYRRIGGGLTYVDDIQMDFPLRDMTAVSGPGAMDQEVFLFLDAEGTRLLVSDVPSLLARTKQQPVKGANPPVTPTTFREGELTSLSTNEAIRLQRALASFGYQVGAIDGAAGRRTAAALRAFQFDNKLDPTGALDTATIVALNAALATPGQNANTGEITARYIDFLGPDLGETQGARLISLGLTQEDPDHPCFGLNEPAPETLWPNSLYLANVLRLLEADLGPIVRVTSAYRSLAHNRCMAQISGLEPEAGHSDFLAFDLDLGDAVPARGQGAKSLVDALGRISDAGLASVEMRVADDAVHVEPRIGDWHAMISSYEINARECRLAKADVDEFARLLADTELAGRVVSLVRTAVSDNYAVTVDLNTDEPAARRAVEIVRGVAAQSADGKTGADSFLQRNRTWYLDPDCLNTRIIGTAQPASNALKR